MRSRKSFVCCAVVSLALLAGGCSDDDDSTSSSSSLSGTLSAGALINEDVTIAAKDSNGTALTCTVTESTATYTCNLSEPAGLTPPYFIKVVGKAAGVEHTLYSVAEGEGTANVNPLTNLVLATVIGADPKEAFDDPASHATTVSNDLDEKTAEVRENLLQVLEDNGYDDANVDPFTATITVGEGMDKVSDFIEITVNEQGGYKVVDKVKQARNSGDEDAATIVSGDVAEADFTQKDETKLTDLTEESENTETLLREVAVALKVADKVSVVDASEQTGSANSLGVGASSVVGALLAPSDLDPNSDYFNDKTFSYVEERSAETFEMANEILCMMAQTRYEKMLNYDPDGDGTVNAYRAQIDESKCEEERDSASSGGEKAQNQSSGSNTPEYIMWVVKSHRESNEDPHIVEVWMNEEADEGGEDPAMQIRAKAEITEGVSDTNPYGLFRLDFVMYPLDSEGAPDIDNPMGKGFLKTEKNSEDDEVLLKFIDTGGFEGNGFSDSWTDRATLQRSPDGSEGSGSGRVQSTFTGSQGQTSEDEQFDFAYDEDWFLKDEPEKDPLCLSRSQFNETVWRYGLYDAEGDRVEVDSGFPIKYNDGDEDFFGWVGYFGLWFPDGVNLQNGAQVVKQDFGSRDSVSETTYTLFLRKGKLIKHEKQTLTLGDLRGLPLQYHACVDFQDPNTCAEYRVEWNGEAFQRTAKLNEQDHLWGELGDGEADTISLTGLQMEDLNFWNQERGGSVRVGLDCEQPGQSQQTNQGQPQFNCTASDDSDVILFEESTVYPGDTVPSNLACFENCPNGSNGENTDPYHDTADLHFQQAPPSQAQRIDYTFDSNRMMLQQGGQDIIRLAGSGQHRWGVHSGPMIEPTEVNLNRLACDFEDDYTCAWQVWEMDVFYKWETGPNDWNRLTLLKRGDEVLTFDPPLNLIYERGATTYHLEYAGFGDLHGIPGRCVDWDSGEEVHCGPNTRWLPEFSIADGSELCDGAFANEACNGTAYLVKGLDKEQQMKEAPNGCSDLSTTSFDLPSIEDWRDPDMGDQPQLDSPPKVIGGIVKRGSAS